MQTVSIHEAKTHLSRLLREVKEGREIVITSSGKPVAKLSAFASPVAIKRKPGIFKGKIWMAADFDTPISESWLIGETDAPFESTDEAPRE